MTLPDRVAHSLCQCICGAVIGIVLYALISGKPIEHFGLHALGAITGVSLAYLAAIGYDRVSKK